jgi:hypothetical protein
MSAHPKRTSTVEEDHARRVIGLTWCTQNCTDGRYRSTRLSDERQQFSRNLPRTVRASPRSQEIRDRASGKGGAVIQKDACWFALGMTVEYAIRIKVFGSVQGHGETAYERFRMAAMRLALPSGALGRSHGYLSRIACPEGEHAVFRHGERAALPEVQSAAVRRGLNSASRLAARNRQEVVGSNAFFLRGSL